MPVRPSARLALVAALVAGVTGGVTAGATPAVATPLTAAALTVGPHTAAPGSATRATAPGGSDALRAQVEQLRADVARTATELALGAQALEGAQTRHAALVQRQARAQQGVDEGADGARRTRSQARTLVRQAYTGARTPRLPLLLTNDLGAVADLTYLRRSLDRVGAAQGALLAGQVRVGASAARRATSTQALRLAALREQTTVDAQLAALSDRAVALGAQLQATGARLQTRLTAERLAAMTAAQQQRQAASAAAAAQAAARAGAYVPALGASVGAGGPGGCLPPGPYSAVNGFLPDAALCPLTTAPGQRLQTAAARAFDALSAARQAASGAPLCVTDSYRSYPEQVDVFRRKPSLAATPGRSQHGWGLAVDLCGGIERFGSEPHAWLLANAAAYGWVHPSWAEPGGSRPEAWHWEYVGGRQAPVG